LRFYDVPNERGMRGERGERCERGERWLDLKKVHEQLSIAFIIAFKR
jgi:hypothetical protein